MLSDVLHEVFFFVVFSFCVEHCLHIVLERPTAWVQYL